MDSHAATQDKSHDVFVDKTEDVTTTEHTGYKEMEGDHDLEEVEDETVTFKTWVVVFVSWLSNASDIRPDLATDSIYGLRTLLLAYPGHR
jgi:hypothetical protein